MTAAAWDFGTVVKVVRRLTAHVRKTAMPVITTRPALHRPVPFTSPNW